LGWILTSPTTKKWFLLLTLPLIHHFCCPHLIFPSLISYLISLIFSPPSFFSLHTHSFHSRSPLEMIIRPSCSFFLDSEWKVSWFGWSLFDFERFSVVVFFLRSTSSRSWWVLRAIFDPLKGRTLNLNQREKVQGFSLFNTLTSRQVFIHLSWT
jgi:hypothetical protein